LLATVGGIVAGHAVPAGAAEPAVAAAEPQAVLEEVTIIAQRRSQNIQDVPIAVTAATGADLDTARVANIANIEALSPSITFRSAAFAASSGDIQIRGIGTSGVSRSFEGSVGVFVDGVYLTRSGQALSNFLDIDNLEILRGPQGTLFGKNTSAGALLLTSNSPSTSGGVSGNYEADYGNYDYYLIKGAINIPLGADAALRVAAITTDHRGYVSNPENTQHYNESDNTGVKAQFLWTPTDALKFRLIGDYSQSVGNCCFGTLSLVNSPRITAIDNSLVTANGLAIPSSDINKMQSQVTPNTAGRTDNYGGTLLVDYKVGSGTLHSVTAVRRFNSSQIQDANFSGASILPVTESFHSQFYSQEFTYSGGINAAITADYIVGAFISYEDLAMARILSWGSQAQTYWSLAIPPLAKILNAAPGEFSDEEMAGTARSDSVFTHWDFKLNDQFHLLAGVRYSHEQKTGSFDPAYFRSKFDPLALLGSMPGIPYSRETTDDSVSGTLSLQYSPTRDAMFYASYNRGFKAGGVNIDVNAAGVPGGISTPRVTQSPIYKPENIDAFEVGAKIDWLDGRARTDGAIFYDRITNLQVAQRVGVVFAILNAPSSNVYGAEIDQLFKVTREVSLTGALTWLPEANYGNSPVLNYIAGGAPQTLSGRRFSYAPRIAATIGPSVEHPITPNLAITGRIQAQYQSQVYSSASTSLIQGSYTRLNANIGIKSYKGWQLELWGQNLADRHYTTETLPNPVFTGNYNAFTGDPATFGIALRGTF
jgi:outer membrane receptor protein involved in Fe transport